MHYAVGLLLCEDAQHLFAVADVGLVERIRLVAQHGAEAIAFELWVVVVIEVVNDNYMVARAAMAPAKAAPIKPAPPVMRIFIQSVLIIVGHQW